MCVQIRKLADKDRETVLGMMRTFYASPFVSTDGSEEIFAADLDACLSHSPYLEGYVFEKDGALLGYAMVAKSFSTEFGKPCIWIEDLYLEEAHRGCGIGSRFLRLLEEAYPHSLFRLEVEAENERAIRAYEKSGFSFLPYAEMKK